GLEDPYGFAIGDRSDAPIDEFLARREHADPEVPRYRFVETLRGRGVPDLPPYQHYELTTAFARSERLVERRQAAYGYTWEDLSTSDMREKYIAGGRLTIVDLRSGEVMAERTGFVFARHRGGGRDRDFWANIENLCPTGRDVPFWVQD